MQAYLTKLGIPIILLAFTLIAAFTGKDVHWPGFIATISFFALIFAIGTYAAKMQRSKELDEVMLAGKRIPLFVAVFTMSATWVGGGYINGSAEFTSSYGLAWVQAPWGYALSLIIGGLFFARRMRQQGYKTMLDPLVEKYGANMGAVLFIPALMGEIFWSAAILTALGTTFGTVLGLDFHTSIILSAIIAIAYTAIGGLWAVALTDIIQLIFLFLGLGIVLPYALASAGGLEAVWTTYAAQKGSLGQLFPPWDGWRHPEWGNAYWNWWDSALLLIFGGIPWQVYFQRVLSAKSANTAMWLSFLAAFVCILAAIPAILIGMVGAVTDWTAIGVTPPENASLTLPYVIRYLTNPIVATLGLGAVAAAVFSSVDSSILSASSMATWNVYRPLVKPNIDATSLTKIIKRCVWIVGIAATLLALQIKSVYALWFLCSDFVYVILFPQLVTALFDKKANRYGAIAGLIVSFILRFGGGEPTLGIPQLIPYPMVDETSGLVYFPFRTLAMISGLVTIMVVSRLRKET